MFLLAYRYTRSRSLPHERRQISLRYVQGSSVSSRICSMVSNSSRDRHRAHPPAFNEHSAFRSVAFNLSLRISKILLSAGVVAGESHIIPTKWYRHGSLFLHDGGRVTVGGESRRKGRRCGLSIHGGAGRYQAVRRIKSQIVEIWMRAGERAERNPACRSQPPLLDFVQVD